MCDMFTAVNDGTSDLETVHVLRDNTCGKTPVFLFPLVVFHTLRHFSSILDTKLKIE